MELLDAYSLGAAEPEEANGLEEHVADCVRCWEQLSEAQRTSAMLALSVAIEEAPQSLRDRILTLAAHDVEERQGWLPALWHRLRGGGTVAVAAVAAAGVAALVFAVVLQVQLSDLRDDNSALVEQMETSDQFVRVLSAPDRREIDIPPTSPETQAAAVFQWSAAHGQAFVTCNKLPPLQGGQVYQVWLYVNGTPTSAGTFTAAEGVGQLPFDMTVIDAPLTGVGISVEEDADAIAPTGKMLLYGSLP
jgi:hypothetical protein